MADVQVNTPPPAGDGGTGAGTLLMGLLALLLVGLLVWFVFLRGGGADADKDINVDVNVPAADGGGSGGGSGGSSGGSGGGNP